MTEVDEGSKMVERMETTTTGARARGRDRLFNYSVSDRPFWPLPENGIIFFANPTSHDLVSSASKFIIIFYFILFPIRG